MTISDRGLALVKRFEGLRLKAYRCPAGVWTIGYGHTGPDVKPGLVITYERAQELLLRDVNRIVADVNQLIGSAKTSQSQFDALCCFAFNVGSDIDADTIAEGLGDSTLLKKHLAGDYAGAAREFPKWNHAHGVALAGLTERRAAEAALYLS